MKIALMTNNYKPFVGGVPISIERLANGLRELGNEVIIFAPTYKEQEEEDIVFRYHSLLEGIAGGVVIPFPWDIEIDKAFEKQQFDIIHVHHPMLIGKTAARLAKKYGIPLVFTYHTRYEQYAHYVLPKPLLKNKEIVSLTTDVTEKYLHSFFNNCQHVFTPTAGLQSYLINDCAYKGSVSVLPTGLEETSYSQTKDEIERIRKKYTKDDSPLFCTVSRMANEKNVRFLLKGISSFKEKYKKPFKVLMIGEGPCKKAFEKQAEELGLSNEVSFLGGISNKELSNYYGASNAFLFASKTETQGIVIIEAFAQGLPVIAVRATGVSDLVVNQKNGFLVSEDINEFSQAILNYVENDENKKTLKQEALRTAHLYTQGEVAQRALSKYNEVIENYHSKQNESKWGATEWKISTIS